MQCLDFAIRLKRVRDSSTKLRAVLDIVCAYIDDFLVSSEDEKQHDEHLRTLFNRLNDYGVIINSAKCEFGAREIPFFGYTVDADRIKPIAERVDAIIKVRKPVTAKHNNIFAQQYIYLIINNLRLQFVL